MERWSGKDRPSQAPAKLYDEEEKIIQLSHIVVYWGGGDMISTKGTV